MLRLLLVSLLTGLAFVAPEAHATSVIYYSDDELFAQADVVLLGVVWRRDVDRGGYPRTDYEIESEECFKGCTARSFVTMSLMGAPADALEAQDEWFMGMPSPKPGARIIVYLVRSRTGRLVPISMGLSHFTVFYHHGLKKHIAHRDVDYVSAMLPVTPGRDTSIEAVVPRDRFAADVVEELRAKKAAR